MSEFGCWDRQSDMDRAVTAEHGSLHAGSYWWWILIMPDGCQGSEALRFSDKYDGGSRGGTDTVISLKAHLTFQREPLKINAFFRDRRGKDDRRWY